MQDLVMSETLVSGLSLGEGGELDKNRVDGLCLGTLVLLLLLMNLRHKLGKLGSAPIDCVDLLANERLETVSRSLLGVQPSLTTVGVTILEIVGCRCAVGAIC